MQMTLDTRGIMRCISHMLTIHEENNLLIVNFG